MSPPIYTPDGSEVSEIVLPDGSTASEVIGPDGNVVFEGPDIPDSEGFEHNDLTGVYNGDTGVFNIQTGTVFEGTYALEASASESDNAIHRDTNTFDRSGLRIDFQTNIGSSSDVAGLSLATSAVGSASMDGYQFRFQNGDLIIYRLDDGSTTVLVTQPASPTTGAWVSGFVEMPSGGDLTFGLDGASVTATDSTYTSLLLGFIVFKGTDYYDDVQFSQL